MPDKLDKVASSLALKYGNNDYEEKTTSNSIVEFVNFISSKYV